MSETDDTISPLQCLFKRSGDMKEVSPEVRRWIFHWDTNCDGLITISDVGSWFHYLFFAPGDAILFGLFSINWLSVFLETGPTDVYGGIVSGLLSIVVWFGVIGATMDFISDLTRALRGHSESE